MGYDQKLERAQLLFSELGDDASKIFAETLKKNQLIKELTGGH